MMHHGLKLKTWKSGRHYAGAPFPRESPADRASKRFRQCKYCKKHNRKCPICAGVY